MLHKPTRTWSFCLLLLIMAVQLPHIAAIGQVEPQPPTIDEASAPQLAGDLLEAYQPPGVERSVIAWVVFAGTGMSFAKDFWFQPVVTLVGDEPHPWTVAPDVDLEGTWSMVTLDQCRVTTGTQPLRDRARMTDPALMALSFVDNGPVNRQMLDTECPTLDADHPPSSGLVTPDRSYLALVNAVHVPDETFARFWPALSSLPGRDRLETGEACPDELPCVRGASCACFSELDGRRQVQLWDSGEVWGRRIYDQRGRLVSDMVANRTSASLLDGLNAEQVDDLRRAARSESLLAGVDWYTYDDRMRRATRLSDYDWDGRADASVFLSYDRSNRLDQYVWDSDHDGTADLSRLFRFDEEGRCVESETFNNTALQERCVYDPPCPVPWTAECHRVNGNCSQRL